VEEAAWLRAPLIIDAEVVHLSADGVSDFDALHSRIADEAVALGFDLLLSGEDIRQQPLIERKTALKWMLRKSREGIQYVEHAGGHGDKLFAQVDGGRLWLAAIIFPFRVENPFDNLRREKDRERGYALCRNAEPDRFLGKRNEVCAARSKR